MPALFINSVSSRLLGRGVVIADVWKRAMAFPLCSHADLNEADFVSDRSHAASVPRELRLERMVTREQLQRRLGLSLIAHSICNLPTSGGGRVSPIYPMRVEVLV